MHPKTTLTKLLFLTLVSPWIGFSTCPSAHAEDVVISTVSKAKQTRVKSISANGDLLASFNVDNNSAQGYLSGNWTGEGASPATVATKKQTVTIRLLTRTGEIVAELQSPIALKNTHSIFSGDIDNSGLDDLIVVATSGASAIILDPAGASQTKLLTLPKADSYHIGMAGSFAIGVASINYNTRQLKVTNSDGGLIISSTLASAVSGELVPISLVTGTFAVGVVEDSVIKVFGQNGELLATYDKSPSAVALTGSFSGTASGYPQVMRVNLSGTLSLLTLATGSITAAAFLIDDPADDPCAAVEAQVSAILGEVSQLIQLGLFGKAQKLSKKLGQIGFDPRCFGMPGISDPSAISKVVQSTRFIPSKLKINGGAALACDEILPARDGAKRGFVLKNGDYTGKVVAVLPGGAPPFSSVNILNKNFKRTEGLKNSGLGNPDSNFMLRQHWRGKASMAKLPGKFFIQGVNGNIKQCWSVNRGSSNRVD